VLHSLWLWFANLLFGTGAVITPAPVDLAAGETVFHAPKMLTPVDDAMSVAIDLGKATEEKKKAILSGALQLHDIGDVRVEVCRSQTECVPATYSGPYFSRDSYGIGFLAIDDRLKGVKFSVVKIRTDRPLSKVVISWGNYTQ
jgi:hypothetical protein